MSRIMADTLSFVSRLIFGIIFNLKTMRNERLVLSGSYKYSRHKKYPNFTSN